MSTELQDALVDVRRAYRLIYYYQKNLLSTIDKIALTFQGTFYWWSPTQYSPPPQRGTDIFKRWSWDLLPFYSTAFFFISEGGQDVDHSPGEWLLSFDLNTDEAFDTAGGEPNPGSFTSAEKSETSLLISLWYCKKAINSEWYYGIWEQSDYPEGEYREYDSPDGLVCVAKKFLLDELENEEKINTSIERYKQLLIKHIPEGQW